MKSKKAFGFHSRSNAMIPLKELNKPNENKMLASRSVIGPLSPLMCSHWLNPRLTHYYSLLDYRFHQ